VRAEFERLKEYGGLIPEASNLQQRPRVPVPTTPAMCSTTIELHRRPEVALGSGSAVSSDWSARMLIRPGKVHENENGAGSSYS
jgi:hypothetical protein